MSADFGYINARIKGLKSRLLGPDFFVQAMGDSDFQAFIATLQQSAYMSDLEEAQAQTSGLPAVDRALARNFWRTTRSMLRFSDGWPHDLIAMLLRRYDLANIKAIARAKHAGRPPEDATSALLPAGELKPAVLDALVMSADISAMAQVLSVAGHPLATAVRRAARDYQNDGDLFDFELALDRAYIGSLLESADDMPLPGSFREYLQLEAQATNLRTALKLRGRDLPPADLYVGTGKRSASARAAFETIIKDTSPEALGVLAGSPFEKVAEADSLSQADAVIRSVLDERVHRLAAGDPLGPFVVLDYLRRKEREMARLRLLARGKFYSVPRVQLEKELRSGVA